MHAAPRKSDMSLVADRLFVDRATYEWSAVDQVAISAFEV